MFDFAIIKDPINSGLKITVVVESFPWGKTGRFLVILIRKKSQVSMKHKPRQPLHSKSDSTRHEQIYISNLFYFDQDLRNLKCKLSRNVSRKKYKRAPSGFMAFS